MENSERRDPDDTAVLERESEVESVFRLGEPGLLVISSCTTGLGPGTGIIKSADISGKCGLGIWGAFKVGETRKKKALFCAWKAN